MISIVEKIFLYSRYECGVGTEGCGLGGPGIGDGGADRTMRNGSGDALAAALLHNLTYCMTSFYALLSDNCMTSK
jgi:hypothetical protein